MKNDGYFCAMFEQVLEELGNPIFKFDKPKTPESTQRRNHSKALNALAIELAKGRKPD